MKRSFVGSGVIIALLWAVTLSVLPELHERVHPDADRGNHECVVTLVASGNYHQAATAPIIVAPVPALQFEKIPALNPQWVESPFLGACIFEHAPPVCA